MGNLLRLAVLFVAFIFLQPAPAFAQTAEHRFQELVQSHVKLIKRSSVKTIGPVIDAIAGGDPDLAFEFLQRWQSKDLWYTKSDERFFYATTVDKKTYQLIDISTGKTAGNVPKKSIKQVRPNSGVRRILASALVKFRLTSPDPNIRTESLRTISREPEAAHLSALKSAIASEEDPQIKTRMERLHRLVSAEFETDKQARLRAIRSFEGDLGLDVRARLNPLLASEITVSAQLPAVENIARVILPEVTVRQSDGSGARYGPMDWVWSNQPELSLSAAYQLLVQNGMAAKVVSQADVKDALIENLSDGAVAGIARSALDQQENRIKAYAGLAADNLVPPLVSEIDMNRAVQAAAFYALYLETDPEVIAALKQTLNSIEASVNLNTFFDLMLDGLSLASIYFLAAIGLAVTFGVMRVINMAHGEFIMMGAYTGYVVQQVISNYTVSLLVALPLAFAVTFAAGVAMERLVIRHLYHRPLETLLATFGISIALQQLAKNIFGTQARPLTSPQWLDGALVFNDVVSISWIRVAIFGLALIFFLGLLFVLNRTRLGLETRAVTQNPKMAASMGINPDKINMLTFGLGSGIAGIAGVAIGLFAKVTSELGSDYIVQSFMTVVVGGVGNIFGTLAGATLIGFLQKQIEFFNPANTLAAQTYMIIFIIIFIQFRPKGIIALKGRAAEA